MGKSVWKIGGAIVLLIGGYFVVKAINNNKKNSEKTTASDNIIGQQVSECKCHVEKSEDKGETQSEEPEELEQQGCSGEKVIEEVNDYSGLCDDEYNNLPRSMFNEMRFSPYHNERLYSVDRLIQENPAEVVNVNLTRYNEKDYLSFLMGIPISNIDSIGVYISSFKKAAEFLKSEYLPYISGYRTKLVPRYHLEYYIRDGESGERIKICSSSCVPPSHLQDEENIVYEDDGQFSYNRTITKLVKNLSKKLDEGPVALNDYLPKFEDLKLVDMSLNFEISFPIYCEEEAGGINLDSAMKCIDYLMGLSEDVKPLNIKFRDGTHSRYDYALFYNPFDECCSQVYEETIDKTSRKRHVEMTRFEWEWNPLKS